MTNSQTWEVAQPAAAVRNKRPYRRASKVEAAMSRVSAAEELTDAMRALTTSASRL